MSLAALAVEFLFGALHLIPEHGHAQIMKESIRWNYTSILNIVFLIITALSLWRFLSTGGPAMLRMMDETPRPPTTTPPTTAATETESLPLRVAHSSRPLATSGSHAQPPTRLDSGCPTSRL